MLRRLFARPRPMTTPDEVRAAVLDAPALSTSILVLPDTLVAHRTGVRRPLVAAPTRNAVRIADADDALTGAGLVVHASMRMGETA